MHLDLPDQVNTDLVREGEKLDLQVRIQKVEAGYGTTVDRVFRYERRVDMASSGGGETGGEEVRQEQRL